MLPVLAGQADVVPVKDHLFPVNPRAYQDLHGRRPAPAGNRVNGGLEACVIPAAIRGNNQLSFSHTA